MTRDGFTLLAMGFTGKKAAIAGHLLRHQVVSEARATLLPSLARSLKGALRRSSFCQKLNFYWMGRKSDKEVGGLLSHWRRDPEEQ